MKLRLPVAIIFIFCFGLSSAQIAHPKASPFSSVVQEIGLCKITIEYSRPATKGRHIFGPRTDGQPGVVPHGRIWRVGANESTKITVNSDIWVMGQNLPKGTYALYAFPGADEWEIAFHTNTSHWGDGRKNYNPEEDLFRIKVGPRPVPYHQENFLMTFDDITHSTANLNLIWASTQLTIPFKVDTDAQMEAEISSQLLENPSAQTYYEAARYLQEQEKDLERALSYLEKAIALGGDTYYFHRVKSLVQAGLGDYNAAVASAQKSLEIAKELDKDEFVTMNNKNIAKWNALLRKKQ